MSDEAVQAGSVNAASTGAGELVGATFWIRGGARIIDQLAHLAILLITLFLLEFWLGLYAGITGVAFEPLSDKVTAYRWFDWVFGCVGLALYHTAMEGMHGSTVGKRLLGLAVTGNQRRPIGLRAAVGRSFAFYFDSLFFGLVAAASMQPPLQQRYGDKWCGTVVTKRSALDRTELPRGGFGTALFVALAADASCHLLSACLKLLGI